MRVAVIGTDPGYLLNFRGHLIRDIIAAGHSVVACCGHGSREQAQQIRGLGAAYRPYTVQRHGMSIRADTSTTLELARIMGEEGVDCSLAYTVKPVVWGTLAAKLAGVSQRYVMVTGLGHAFIAHSGLRARALGGLVRLLYTTSLAFANGAFFQNGDDEAFFRDYGMLRNPATRTFRIAGSGVDVDHYAEAPVPDGVPSFLFVGRLLRDKGVAEFAEAARLLKRAYPAATFRVLGPSDTNPAAISAAELNEWVATGAVEYLGQTDDVRSHLRACTVFVLPSYREGTPRSALEAMAVGRAIVATDVPGCREVVVPGENGYLVPARSVEPLAAAMRRFVENPDLAAQMGSASRSLAEQRFDVRKVNADIIQGMGLSIRD